MKKTNHIILIISLFGVFSLKICAFDLTQNCLDISIQDLSKKNEQYQINQDKSVTDLNTGLTWASCLYGTVGETCNEGNLLSVNWNSAFNATTTNLDKSQTDWRIPSILELATLLESSCNKPSINVTIFRPLLETFQKENIYYFWSSTTDYSDVSRAYVIDVMTGEVVVKSKEITSSLEKFYTLIVKSN